MPWWSRTEQRRRGDDVLLHDLADRHALAVEYLAAGEAGESVPLMEQALSGCRAELGPDHPTSLQVAGNLAAACVAAGLLDEGAELMAANLADRRRVLGDDDPRTLSAADATAVTYRLAGRLAEALALSGQVTAERRRLLGPTHPDTLVSRMGLAMARAAAGEAESAIALLRATLGEAEPVHGTHRHTVALRACLAGRLAALGAVEEARREFAHAVADSTALLGADHPETQAIVDDLDHVDRAAEFAVGGDRDGALA